MKSKEKQIEIDYYNKSFKNVGREREKLMFEEKNLKRSKFCPSKNEENNLPFVCLIYYLLEKEIIYQKKKF